MNVCDKCKKEQVILTLRFKTKDFDKSFDICGKCGFKIVKWLEDKPLKEKMSALWDKTNLKYNAGTIGGGI